LPFHPDADGVNRVAGGAGVILLDEPTAGMGRGDTRRFIELIREATA
jgi:branched-chain amino acid transport system ATP-binding protein